MPTAAYRSTVELSRSGTIRDAAKEARMIRFKTGDILAEGAEALVNTVNCVGGLEAQA